MALISACNAVASDAAAARSLSRSRFRSSEWVASVPPKKPRSAATPATTTCQNCQSDHKEPCCTSANPFGFSQGAILYPYRTAQVWQNALNILVPSLSPYLVHGDMLLIKPAQTS